jgi:cob(I)alamin adenosyltransferase
VCASIGGHHSTGKRTLDASVRRPQQGQSVNLRIISNPAIINLQSIRQLAIGEVVKIYTRTGDTGETALFDGTRVRKSDPRVDAYGEVDELSAWLGLVRASGTDDQIGEMLEQIQRDLFALGARLADPAHRIADRVSKAAVTADDVARLEHWIDSLEAQLSPLRKFILAGGSSAGAMLHVARTVCRRAERTMAALGADAFEHDLLVYINRLSDLLFVMARSVNRRAGAPEVEW